MGLIALPTKALAPAIGVRALADFWAFDSMRQGPVPQLLHHDALYTPVQGPCAVFKRIRETCKDDKLINISTSHTGTGSVFTLNFQQIQDFDRRLTDSSR